MSLFLNFKLQAASVFSVLDATTSNKFFRHVDNQLPQKEEQKIGWLLKDSYCVSQLCILNVLFISWKENFKHNAYEIHESLLVKWNG